MADQVKHNTSRLYANHMGLLCTITRPELHVTRKVLLSHVKLISHYINVYTLCKELLSGNWRRKTARRQAGASESATCPQCVLNLVISANPLPLLLRDVSVFYRFTKRFHIYAFGLKSLWMKGQGFFPQEENREANVPCACFFNQSENKEQSLVFFWLANLSLMNSQVKDHPGKVSAKQK